MTENEEMYYGLARQFIEPEWIPNSFVFTESPGTRLLFQLSIGPILTLVPFEWVSIVGQLITYGIYAWLLVKIFAYFKLSNVLIFFLLQLLFMTLQAFLAGEWIFRNFETKSIAYIFIFLSIINLLKTEWKKAVLWCVPAFYFHVLVGGWYFIALMIFLLLKKLAFKQLFGYGLWFLLLTSPFLAYLFNDILISQEKIIAGVNLDWVYTYFRNPHHTVTFHMGWPWFRRHRAEGIAMLILAAILGAALYPKSKENYVKNTWLFCFSTYALLWFFLLVSYLDTNGSILKFYVYRIASVSFLLTLVLLLYHLATWLKDKKFANLIYFACLLASLIYLPIKIADNIRKETHKKTELDQALIDVLRQKGQAGQSVAFFDKSFKTYFPRETRLEPVVSFKFVPSGTEKLFEWYTRLQEKEKAEENPALIRNYCNKYGAKFIVSKQPIEGFTIILENEAYYVYEVIAE